MKQLNQQSYSDKLRDPRWQKKRLEVMQRDAFTCVICGDAGTPLNIHHSKYSGDPWDVEIEHLKTVCEHCHSAIHELGEQPILKAIKILSPDASHISLFAFTEKSMVAFYLVFGSAISIHYTIEYPTLKILHNNIPE